jgi:hypothetical protein
VFRVRDDPKSVFVAQVLGARQLGQAALSGVEPSPGILAMGVWVDMAHATTAVGLAAVDRERRFAGFINAVSALGWAGWGHADLRTGLPTSALHDRRRDRLSRWALRFLPGGSALLSSASNRHA